MINKNHKANILIEVIVIKQKEKKNVASLKRRKIWNSEVKFSAILGIGLLPICLETSVLLVDGRFYFRKWAHNGSTYDTLKSTGETKSGSNKSFMFLYPLIRCNTL